MTAQNNIEHTLHKLSPVFQQYPLLMKEWHECAVDRADVEFIFEKLSKLPEPITRILLSNAFKIKQRRERNLYILRNSKFILELLPERLRGSLTVEDDEVRNISNDCAERCRRIALMHNEKGRIKAKESESLTDEGVNGLKRINSNQGEALTEISVTNSNEIFRLLSSELEYYGIKPFDLKLGNITALGAIRRMCDKHWWTRKLRKVFNQAYEKAVIQLGMVNKHKQIYASDLTVKKRRQQLFANEQLMSSMTVINDIGQRYSLKELSDLNVSNPKVRKAELMVRIRGFEETSKSLGHVGLFITITCPSKYHSIFAKSGQSIFMRHLVAYTSRVEPTRY